MAFSMSPSALFNKSTKPYEPFYYRHVPKNLLLILLSAVAVPFTSILVLLSLIYTKLNPAPRSLEPRDGDAGRKTILITGVSMTKGLTIARLLAQHTPHRIIGADTSPLSPGRFSTSISKFHTLVKPDGGDAEPYIDSLLTIIRNENVDLWISCSSVVAAVEDGQAVRLAEQVIGKGFKAVQFREDVVEKLHEKDKFVEYIRELGLTVPESHRCTNQEEVLNILLRKKQKHKRASSDESGSGCGNWDGINRNGNGHGIGHRHRGRKFILKPIGVDDHARNNMMTLLPFRSAEETRTYIKSLQITPSNPFQVQQFIQGDEYCTHALVVRGRVVAFVACPSSELLMHYFALPADSQLSETMLSFTQRVAEDGGEDFTGHLSFDFLVPRPTADPKPIDASNINIDGLVNGDQKKRGGGRKLIIYPIECNPRAHTAIALFSSTPELASAYLSVLSPSLSSSTPDIITPHSPTYEYYWIGHDLVSCVLLPLLDVVWGLASMDDVLQGWVEFWEHVVGWWDGTFTIDDPTPFWVLYHVYWPVVFLKSIWMGKRWSRINVSTTKVFEG